MKTEQVNLRLEADLIAALESAAQAEGLERGTMIRKLIREGLGHWSIERALQRYQRGEISIGRASEDAGRSHWDMLDLIRGRGIAYPLSPDEAEARIERLTGRPSRVAERGPAYGRTPPSKGPFVSRGLPDRAPKRGGVLMVGINPAPISVRAGHYYQGKLGKRLWRRLERVGLLRNATPGHEDDAFVAAGNGLTDLVKRPTRAADDLSREEIALGVEELKTKVRAWSPRLILFVFQNAARVAQKKRAVAAGSGDAFEGVPTFLLSGPYASRFETDRVDALLIELLGGGPAGGVFSLPVTASDLGSGRIRIPKEAKALFAGGRTKLEVTLRGERLEARYDSRQGPDRERSAVLSIDRRKLGRLVRPQERLRVRKGADGSIQID